jgi:hypothetical protein
MQHFANVLVRYKASEENLVVMEIKHEICKIFSLKLDHRQNNWITSFLQMYKYQFENELLVNGKIALDVESKVLRTLFHDKFENQFNDIDRVLLDLTHYENLPLATFALHLLFRAHSMQEEFAENLHKVEILVSGPMAASYDKLRKLKEQMDQLLRSPRIDEKDGKQVAGLLEEVIADIQKNGGRSQRIVRNLQIHTSVLISMKNTMNRSSLRQLHRCSTYFLIEFVRGNEYNQRLVFQHMDMLLSFLSTTRIEEVTTLLYAIVKDNNSLAANIEDRQVRTYVDIIVDAGKKPNYLNFLRALIIVKGKAIKRNQTLVTKNLIVCMILSN